MSRKQVQAVIGSAIGNSEFRKRLFSQPDRALSHFDLTQAEVAALQTIDAETLDALAGRSEKDISESLAIGLYAGMLAAGRHLQDSADADRAECGMGSLSRDANARVVNSKRFLDWSREGRKEVLAMKRWKLLSAVCSLVAIVALFGFAASATRAPSEPMGTDSAEAAAKAIAVSSGDDTYGPLAGVPNVYESAKRSVEYEGYNPLTADGDPWLYGFEITESTSSAEAPAKAIAVSSGDDMYGPPPGVPNVYEPVKRSVVYEVYPPDTADPDPWLAGLEVTEPAASKQQALPELDATYSSWSQHNTVPIRRNMPQAYTGYNPQTDPYDPWMY